MPSILYGNADVDFIARKNFRLDGVDYTTGDDCTEINDHPKLEVFVRNGYVIPVVDDKEQLPFQFRRTVMTREMAYKKLRLGNPLGSTSNRLRGEKDWSQGNTGVIDPLQTLNDPTYAPVMDRDHTVDGEGTPVHVMPKDGAPEPQEPVTEPFEATPVDPEASPASEPESEPVEVPLSETEQELDENEFNPRNHSIPEVMEYVEENPEEVTSVYVLEEQGKNRSSLLSKLDEVLNTQMNEKENDNG